MKNNKINTWVVFAIAFSMFPKRGTIEMQEASPEQIQELLKTGNYGAGWNPSHTTTIAALKQRHALELPELTAAPKVVLKPGDRAFIISVTGLPRETREYTEAEIAATTFEFGLWTLVSGSITIDFEGGMAKLSNEELAELAVSRL